MPGLLKAVALDKTGTITEGKPKLVKWQVWVPVRRQQSSKWPPSLAAGPITRFQRR